MTLAELDKAIALRKISDDFSKHVVQKYVYEPIPAHPEYSPYQKDMIRLKIYQSDSVEDRGEFKDEYKTHRRNVIEMTGNGEVIETNYIFASDRNFTRKDGGLSSGDSSMNLKRLAVRSSGNSTSMVLEKRYRFFALNELVENYKNALDMTHGLRMIAERDGGAWLRVSARYFGAGKDAPSGPSLNMLDLPAEMSSIAILETYNTLIDIFKTETVRANDSSSA